MERLRIGVDGSNNHPFISTDSDGDLPLKIRTGTNNSEAIRFNANNTTTFANAFTFPSSDGNANQILKTNGSGTVVWADETTGGGAASSAAKLTDGGTASTHPGTSCLLYTGQTSAGGSVLGMPTINNANAIITMNKHSGEYNSQLGFSSNGNIYYRNFNNAQINNTQSWEQLAFVSSSNSLYLAKSGGTMSGTLDMNNYNIVGVNRLDINDPGGGEGINWSNIKIYESPNDGSNTSGNFQVEYSGTRRLTVDSSGILVNGRLGNLDTTNDTGQQLENNGADYATLRCDANRWRVYMGGSGNSQETLTVNESGNVGIKDPTPSYRLDVAGTIRATSDVIAFSDERVKENIKTIDNSLEKVNKLRGVEFNKIGEDTKSIGVIAQEVEKILPEVVRTDDEGMKSVAYGNVVGVLIEAVKELTKEVEELKKCNKCKNCNCND